MTRERMTEEPWNKHTPGDPMPCKCGDSLVEVRLFGGETGCEKASRWVWGKRDDLPCIDVTDWRFVERKGEDVIDTDPYDALEWDEGGIATVVLKEPGQPEWVRDDDLVRFGRRSAFLRADFWQDEWWAGVAFQIKRRPVLTPAEPQLLALLATAIDDEAIAIRQAARRANIEVPE